AKLEGSDGPTGAGDVVGTLRYMAPERFQGQSDPRNDVYGLGATLYELLALRPPFDDPDWLHLIDKIAHDPPTPLRQLARGIPRDLEAIVLKCLAKDPAERYPTARALAADLGRFTSGEPVSVRAARVVERAAKWARRKPTLAAAYTLGLL